MTGDYTMRSLLDILSWPFRKPQPLSNASTALNVSFQDRRLITINEIEKNCRQIIAISEFIRTHARTNHTIIEAHIAECQHIIKNIENNLHIVMPNIKNN